MSSRLLKYLLGAFVIQTALPDIVSACTCLGGRVQDRAAYQQWFQQRTVVFRGTVIADELLPEVRITAPNVPNNITFRPRRVTFNVERQWKGVEGSTVAVVTDADGGMCGIDYRQGGRYVVAADQRPVMNADLTLSQTPELRTDTCIGPAWLRDEKSFLAAFGEGQPPN
jgi:hypothetical protein